jgi:hypothetical protein
MSKDDPNNINYYHNKGEQDRAEGNGYNPPNGFLGGVFNLQYEDDQRAAYEAGWDNADEQAHDD